MVNAPKWSTSRVCHRADAGLRPLNIAASATFRRSIIGPLRSCSIKPVPTTAATVRNTSHGGLFDLCLLGQTRTWFQRTTARWHTNSSSRKREGWVCVSSSTREGWVCLRSRPCEGWFCVRSRTRKVWVCVRSCRYMCESMSTAANWICKLEMFSLSVI